MINYRDLHKRIKRSRAGPACTSIYVFIFISFFFNLVAQLYSAAITETQNVSQIIVQNINFLIIL